MTAQQVAWVVSNQFLESPEWRAIRYEALKMNDGRCECCGRNKHQLPPGTYLCVDHIKSRRECPDLALDIKNLQILDTECNHGKMAKDATDWRHPGHLHRNNTPRHDLNAGKGNLG